MELFESIGVGPKCSQIEQNKSRMGDVRGLDQGMDGRRNSDCRSFVYGIAESSGRDRGKSQRADPVVVGNPDGFTMATCQCFGRRLSTVSIDRTDGVDHIFGWQASAGG